MTDSRISEAWNVPEIHEQIRNGDEALIVWVDQDGAIHETDTGVMRCKRCGHVDVYKDKDEPCKNCERLTSYEVITRPEFEEPWLPYPYPDPIFDISVETIGNEISDILSRTIVLQNNQDYEILTSWIIASYRQQDWKSAPYLQFIAPISSGKTRALEILSLLSYHGVLYATISPAALCREIEKYKVTPFVDQAEYNFDTRVEPGRENYAIWMCGYRKGQKYVRAKQDSDDDVVRRDVFGFKALASNRVFDEALVSRSITFFMREGIPEIKDITEDVIERIQKIRAKLIFLHLMPESPFHNSPAIEQLNGRLREIYTPLLFVVDTLGWGTDDVIDFAKRDSIKKIKEMQQTTEGIIVRTIKNLIDDNIGKTNLDNELIGITLKDISEKTSIDTRIIGHKLKALDIDRKHDRDGAYIDLTDRATVDQIKYLFRKYGIDVIREDKNVYNQGSLF